MTRDELRTANRARFARLVAHPDADVDLALGALLIAADSRPGLAPEPTLAALDGLADRSASGSIAATTRPRSSSEAIGLLGPYLDERPDGADAGEVRQVIGIFRGRRN